MPLILRLLLCLFPCLFPCTRVPPTRDDAEDETDFSAQLSTFNLETPSDFKGSLLNRWRDVDKRCCSQEAARLVVDTHGHVWNEDPRPNRGKNQLGLLEDWITEGWGEGVHLGVMVQPGFRDDKNDYILRSLELFPGTLSAELEAVRDYTTIELQDYHELGVRGLRFKATSPEKYETIVKPRLESLEFTRIASFLKANQWHWGVQLAKEVGYKWAELLGILQATGVPIIIDMFGRPDPLVDAGEDAGTKAILAAAARPPPAGKIWMEFGGPFRVDPRCTYAEPEAADPAKCLEDDRVRVARRGGGSRLLCCPEKTHNLLIELAEMFVSAVGQDFVVWGTDWPYISDLGVTTQGLLDVMAEWVPDEELRGRILGINPLRPNAVDNAPLYPLINRLPYDMDAGAFGGRSAFAVNQLSQMLPQWVTGDAPDVADFTEDNEVLTQAQISRFPPAPGATSIDGSLVERWRVVDGRCCSASTAPLVIDTHYHVWDEDPRPNRGLNQLGLLEDALTEGWGVHVLLGVLVQPGFRGTNNDYILKSLEKMPGRLAGEVEALMDYTDEVLREYDKLGVRGLRFKATSLEKYERDIKPRLVSPEFSRIATFVKRNDWHWGVQLSKEVGSKWSEILDILQATESPIIIDMFGRPDPMVPAFQDNGTKAIIEAARRPPPAGKIWVELGGPFRVDPRCTYAEPAAADPQRCKPEDRVSIPRRGTEKSRFLCCPIQTHDLLVSLTQLFLAVVGPEYIIWGTDWPFISDQGVTIRGLLDATATWVHNATCLSEILGENPIRPNMVGMSPLFPLNDPRKLPGNEGSLLPGVFFLLLFITALATALALEIIRFMAKPKPKGEAGLVAGSVEVEPVKATVKRVTSRTTGSSEPMSLAALTKAGMTKVSSAKAALEKAASTTIGDAAPDGVPGRKGGKLAVDMKGGAQNVAARLERIAGDLEPIHGCPPPTLRYPILGDFIAGVVKAIVELVGCLTFAALMTPDEYQPFLPIFLNYAMWGFIVSQVVFNLLTHYLTAGRTCNISAAIFFLEVINALRVSGESPDVAVNTLLMVATITTWLAGLLTWIIGTFKLTQFVRFLSAPVKLGMQVSLGYFLFATGFSISSGVSWLNFTTLEEFSIYLEPLIWPKIVLTAICASFIFYALNKWGWPYTIPVFVAVGIAVYHGIAFLAGVDIEEGKETGWLYPPPDGGGGLNPFDFFLRIYDVGNMSWGTIRACFGTIITAALISPVLSAVINLVLFETSFSEEEVGRSTLSYELRMDGLTLLFLTLSGGYVTSVSAGGTAVHRKVGARSNCGLFTSVVIHLAFLLIPGSTEVLKFVPKFVVGAVSLIVAISMLDSGLRGGYRQLSAKEYSVVIVTLLTSVSLGLQSGIAAGWILSFALFIQETANATPMKLDVDAGLVASHVLWGLRSSALVSRLRGAVRLVSLQGYLFFAATQPALIQVEKEHLQGDDVPVMLIVDFSAVFGMDDSTSFEFKILVSKAKKAGVQLTFCSCRQSVLDKLQKVAAIPTDVSEIGDEDDLLPAAQSAAGAFRQPPPPKAVTGAKGGGCCFPLTPYGAQAMRGESAVPMAPAKADTVDESSKPSEPASSLFIVGSADRAIEFCELMMALRTQKLCPQVLGRASADMVSLKRDLETPLKSYRRQASCGDRVECSETDIFILVEGAFAAVMETKDAAGKPSKPEDVVIYRTLPGLECDYSFACSAGVLQAVAESTYYKIPSSSLNDLRGKLVKKLREEFMTLALQPTAIKATFHDVCGTFNSGVASEFRIASDAVTKGDMALPIGTREAQQQTLSRLLAARSAKPTYQQPISVVHDGRRPPFEALASADTALTIEPVGDGKVKGDVKVTGKESAETVVIEAVEVDLADVPAQPPKTGLVTGFAATAAAAGATMAQTTRRKLSTLAGETAQKVQGLLDCGTTAATSASPAASAVGKFADRPVLDEPEAVQRLERTSSGKVVQPPVEAGDSFKVEP
eukprot:TRINITY_DN30169_c0_g2_i1.p1 TRINITY_DN30169_c0_g2~~TRINITY_DN30169_c0_g2_i1.p1  ORF type:complete len:1973 (-),score=311.30 TRINITY_DN30169_c0_g2_i1:291-6209(-)